MRIANRLMTAVGKEGPKPISYSYRNTYVSSVDSSSYTFPSSDIGAADPARMVVVGVSMSNATLNRGIGTVSVGGVLLTQRVYTSGQANSGSVPMGFYTGIIPLGAVADIVITSSGGGVSTCSASVWAVYNAYSEVPTDSNAQVVTIDPAKVTSVVDNGAASVILGLMANVATTNRTVTWSGATEVFDTVVQSGVATISGASDLYNTAQVGRTITSTSSSSTLRSSGAVGVWAGLPT